MIEQARQSESEFNVTRIRGIIFSGQMQDVIVLNGELNPVRNAILYSDGRAEEQAKQLAETYQGGAERFLNTVGNRLEGCLPLPKLMWLREHEPETYARIRHVLISSKDYLIAQLTGECVGDVAACSTAGAMNIRNGQWDAELCEVAEIDMTILPHLHNPQDNIGTVTESAAQRTGFSAGTAVYAGIGDAGATTLASGVSHPGQYNINIGTSGWIATVSPEPFTGKPGAANLAFGVEEGFVNRDFPDWRRSQRKCVVPDSGRCVGASHRSVRQCRYSASSGNGLVGIQCTRPAAISMRMHCIPAES